jgi:thiamine transport system permease protein
MLREVLPGVALVILVICLTSFAVVITLGGGPKATTIELAIYQAVRFEFDLAASRGAGGVQVAMGSIGGAGGLALTRPAGFGAGLDRESLPCRPRRLAALAVTCGVLAAGGACS